MGRGGCCVDGGGEGNWMMRGGGVERKVCGIEGGVGRSWATEGGEGEGGELKTHATHLHLIAA